MIFLKHGWDGGRSITEANQTCTSENGERKSQHLKRHVCIWISSCCLYWPEWWLVVQYLAASQSILCEVTRKGDTDGFVSTRALHSIQGFINTVPKTVPVHKSFIFRQTPHWLHNHPEILLHSQKNTSILSASSSNGWFIRFNLF